LAPPPAGPEDALAALRQSLPGQFEKAPNRPVYLRQVRQLLRAAGATFDERSGFRGLLDLLHQAQREGWLRLHRDRKGVWRVFPAGPTPAAVPPTSAEVEAAPEPPPDLELGLEPAHAVELEPELEPDILMPFETDVNWEAEPLPEEAEEPLEPPPPPVVEEVVAAEPAPQPKTRKARASKAGAKSPKRKASTRRKTKEPSRPSEE